MKVLILFSVFGFALARECGENQHYDPCRNACEIDCENFLDPPSKFCHKDCESGCYCDKGFVKTKDGRCVKPEQCPAEEFDCGQNRHYDQCGTFCPVTCENFRNPPRACVKMCNQGCHCDKGFVKTKDERCVKPEQCPAEEFDCGENRHYDPCGPACPITCENFRNPPKVCHKKCALGCHCDKGFVKRKDGRCVKPEQCPAQVLRATSEVLRLPPKRGRCRDYFKRHFYSKKYGRCQKFIYGGCGGNKNHLKNLEKFKKTSDAKSNVCDLPPDPGLCRAYIPKYYYDSKRGKCKKFVYGGCGGNDNNFSTLEDCQKTCGSS